MNRPRKRRAVIRAGAGVLAGILAGCATGPRSTDSTATRPGRSSNRDASNPDASNKLAPGAESAAGGTNGANSGVSNGSSDSEALLLPAVDVTASPGGLIDVAPADVVVLLDFFATWCPPCKPEMANLRAVRSRFDREAVFVVSITQESDVDAIERFWNAHDGTWPVAMDPDLRATREYGARHIPTVVVLDPDGTEAARHTGLVGESTLVGQIEAALNGATS